MPEGNHCAPQGKPLRTTGKPLCIRGKLLRYAGKPLWNPGKLLWNADVNLSSSYVGFFNTYNYKSIRYLSHCLRYSCQVKKTKTLLFIALKYFRTWKYTVYFNGSNLSGGKYFINKAFILCADRK
ncbi:MAG: hypothetical protein IPL53_03245 [Ignavibacteria bacterium]|nr:hypothetical protein [Ignavibacteria bacterium]